MPKAQWDYTEPRSSHRSWVVDTRLRVRTSSLALRDYSPIAHTPDVGSYYSLYQTQVIMIGQYERTLRGGYGPLGLGSLDDGPFLVEIPHDPDEASCKAAFKVFAETRSHYLARADFGYERRSQRMAHHRGRGSRRGPPGFSTAIQEKDSGHQALALRDDRSSRASRSTVTRRSVQNCQSALDLGAPNARTERRSRPGARTHRSAHRA